MGVKRRRNRIQEAEVNFRHGTIVHENLPYPIVYYPGHYGAFFGFKKTDDSTLVFCSCCREAIVNYVRSWFRNQGPYLEGTINYVFDSDEFPREFAESVINAHVESQEEVLNRLVFEDALCHECNQATPSMSWCHPMYGGRFRQKYGWYIKKLEYELDIYGEDPKMDGLPVEVVDLVKQDIFNPEYDEIMLRLEQQGKIDEARAIDRERTKQMSVIKKYIENEVRHRFGQKEIGSAWTSETILFQIISRLYSSERIKRHYRGPELDGLELDIYLPDLRLGIEYQGIQHFEPVKHWGGEKGLARTQERDKKKRRLCESLGIRLIYFYYYEEMSEPIVSQKLCMP